MRIKNIIKEYFSYSSKEKNGLMVLAAIMIAVFVLPSFFKSSNSVLSESVQKNEKLDSILSLFTKEENVKSFETFQFDPNIVSVSEMKRLGFSNFQIKNLQKYRQSGGVFRNSDELGKIYGMSKADLARLVPLVSIQKSKKIEVVTSSHNKNRYELFEFNPNTIDVETWIKLGVKKKLANRIRKYLSTGARFYKASDLHKIYGLDSLTLNRITPYVRIHEEVCRYPQKAIDINTADTSLLKSLPGIGTVLSARIIKYRSLLGGFVSKKQLLEVYGIDKNTYNKIKFMLIVSKIELKKKSINHDEIATLKKHPYITKRMAQDIIRYRNRNGLFKEIDELNTKHLLTDSIFQKIKPYLSID